MVGPVGPFLLRHRPDRAGLVAFEVPGRSDVGRMRADEPHEQHPRTAVAGVGAQPVDGVVGVAHVVGQVGRIAGAGRQDAGARVADRRILAQAAEQVALPVHHVQRLDLARETAVVAAAEVQLADRVAGQPVPGQVVAPARHAAVVRVGVVPVADLVHVASGGKRGSRRHAQRAVGVGGLEPGAGGGQPVQVGRDAVAAVAAGAAQVVLVRQDEQQIGGRDGAGF